MVNIGNRVIVGNNDDRKTPLKGTVENVHVIDDTTIVIVRIDDGPLLKLRADNVELAPQEENPDVITISREEFEKVITKVVNPDRYGDKFSTESNSLLLSMCGIVICNELKKELFGETADND